MTPPMRITFMHETMKRLQDMKPSPYQRNVHTKEQIIALAKVMVHDGVRQPIHISLRSGFICFGHGRREAALLNDWEEYPVQYQDFQSDEEEYRCVQSDNGLAQWSEIDRKAINMDIGSGKLGPFDLSLLGIHGFGMSPPDPPEEKPPGEKAHVDCPSCGESFVPQKAPRR